MSNMVIVIIIVFVTKLEQYSLLYQNMKQNDNHQISLGWLLMASVSLNMVKDNSNSKT